MLIISPITEFIRPRNSKGVRSVVIALITMNQMEKPIDVKLTATKVKINGLAVT
jgi:hypothetical protein